MDNFSNLTPISSSQSISLNQHLQKQEQQETYHDKIPTTNHESTENKSIRSRFFSWIAGVDVKTTLASVGGIILGISLTILGIIKNYQASQPTNPFFPNLPSTPPTPVLKTEEKASSTDVTQIVTQQASTTVASSTDVSPASSTEPTLAEPVASPIVTQPVETPTETKTPTETETEIPQSQPAPSVFEALNGPKVERVDNQMMKNRVTRPKQPRRPTASLRKNVEKMAISAPTAPVEKPVEEATTSPATTVNSRANPKIGSRIAHLQQQGGIKFQLPGMVPNPRKPAQSQEDQSSQVDGTV